MPGLFDHLDPPTGPPRANPEEAARDEILADLGSRNAEVLEWLRKRLAVIYRLRVEDVGREFAYVTADDARRLIATLPAFKGKCLNFLGSLFKAKGWRPTGEFHKSETPGSHANRLVRWRYEGE